jgi:uncharacterized protein YcbX
MADIKALYRYPVKGFSPEPLTSVTLLPSATMPFDRAYAVENGPVGFDPSAPRYFPKARFLMLMRNERIARLRTQFDPETTHWRITSDGEIVVEGRLDSPEERARIEAWIAHHFADELRGTPKILAGNGHSFSDVAKKVLHVVNLATVQDLERELGRPIDPLRFRANVYIDGLAPWAELDWVGKRIAAPGVTFKGVGRTVRCAATNVDPATGMREGDLPRDIERLQGHADCGIYVEVVSGGVLAIGDSVEIEQMALNLD